MSNLLGRDAGADTAPCAAGGGIEAGLRIAWVGAGTVLLFAGAAGNCPVFFATC